jgi:hypothetical protein
MTTCRLDVIREMKRDVKRGGAEFDRPRDLRGLRHAAATVSGKDGGHLVTEGV